MERRSPLSIKELLQKYPISASAPCRIDIGGTVDIKAMAIPLERLSPTTINMTLSLRTTVRLLPYKDGMIKIGSKGFEESIEVSLEEISFKNPFSIYLCAIRHFNLTGLEVEILSSSPPRSGLGGSSSALIALLGALWKVEELLRGILPDRERILHLAYQIEDSVMGGFCGMQDHAAALYGGVNQWIWSYGDPLSPYRRIRLIEDAQSEMKGHIVVAYSGLSHSSSEINRGWIEDFLSGKTANDWIKANEIVWIMADALKDKDWNRASRLLREEVKLRRKITPDAFTPLTQKMIDMAEGAGCGARFAGAGGGGCVWALGNRDEIEILKERWNSEFSDLREFKILDSEISSSGLSVD